MRTTNPRSRARRVRRVGVAIGVVMLVGSGCTDPEPIDSASAASTTGAPTTTTSTTSTTTTVAPAPTAAPGPGGFAPTAAISEPVRIGPAPGSELDGIDRDAGISVALRDGSTLWLFGDTARADDFGSLEYFEIGTAAWAPPGSPTVTQDYSTGGEPVPFAVPVAGFPPCPGLAPVGGMWPSSAVVQQVGALDRVVVWLENICLGSSTRGAARGMAVAEWFYDPDAPPTDIPIQGRILNQTLFPTRSFGIASVLDGEGNALVFSCNAPEQGGQPQQYGPCHAARVPLEAVANPSAYEVWDGTGWSSDASAARPLDMADGGLAQYPAGSFSIAPDPHLGGFVMVYSPWPGFSDFLQVRTAPTALGPWSAPTAIPLPGCSDTVGTSTFWCYAASAQPIFSEPGKLGVGYYDRHVTSNPTRGSYLVATIPYDPAGES